MGNYANILADLNRVLITFDISATLKEIVPKKKVIVPPKHKRK